MNRLRWSASLCICEKTPCYTGATEQTSRSDGIVPSACDVCRANYWGLSVKILTLVLGTIAFLMNGYALVEVVVAGIAFENDPDPYVVGSFWRWGLLFSVIPELITVIALGLALRFVLKGKR